MAMADTELAGSLVEVLDRLGEDEGWEGPGFFLRADAEKVDVMPLGGRHPEQLLLGHRVDPEWRAIGLLTWGWGAPADGPLSGTRPSQHPERVRSRTAIAVGRYGEVKACSRLADGRVLHEAPEGWLVDCLLRAVDRPTPPPTVGTEALFAAHWLASLLAEVRASRGLTWDQAAGLHPALQMLAMADEIPLDADSLVPAAAALSRVCGWKEVRWQCIERSWLDDQVSSSIAAWMDTGMLSRYLLGGTTPVV